MSVKPAVPVDVSEEYYQIGNSILSSFHKYRPPLDLFVYNEKVNQLIPYFNKGGRLTNEQVEEVVLHCAEGNLFVSRTDHSIYSKHIAEQLDLILLDENLKDGEIVLTCLTALDNRLKDFFDQPVLPVYERLEADAFVVTEYLWTDVSRLDGFLNKLWVEEYTFPRHALNSLFIGLYLLLATQKINKELTRKEFNQATMAFLLHDVGMAKIPVSLYQKERALKPDERTKIGQHVLGGATVMRKLEHLDSFMEQAIMEHHERLDGTGYPQHVKEISYFGRLVSIVDTFSAMIQKRIYAEAKPFMAAASEIALDHRHYDKEISGVLLSGVVASKFGGTQE